MDLGSNVIEVDFEQSRPNQALVRMAVEEMREQGVTTQEQALAYLTEVREWPPDFIAQELGLSIEETYEQICQGRYELVGEQVFISYSGLKNYLWRRLRAKPRGHAAIGNRQRRPYRPRLQSV